MLQCNVDDINISSSLFHCYFCETFGMPWCAKHFSEEVLVCPGLPMIAALRLTLFLVFVCFVFCCWYDSWRRSNSTSRYVLVCQEPQLSGARVPWFALTNRM